MIDETFHLLAGLAGVWEGRGAGDYPTIDAFAYEERLRIESGPSYPMFHYEQRAYLLPDREPSHWESGFIRPLEDGMVDVSSAQDSGRVEVLRGRPIPGKDPGSFEIVLDSEVLGHDARLVQTRRVITLGADTLRYVKYMATHTTESPVLTQHLEATLRRVPEDG